MAITKPPSTIDAYKVWSPIKFEANTRKKTASVIKTTEAIEPPLTAKPTIQANRSVPRN